jgi:hypothetical protein
LYFWGQARSNSRTSRVGVAFDGQLFFFADGRAVALIQSLAVQLHGALRHLQPGVTSRAQIVPHLLPWLELSRVEAGVLIYGDRPVLAIGTGDQAQLAALFGFRKRLLFVAGLVAFAVGQNPYLQQMRLLGLRRIGLAVPHAAAGAHALSLARANDGTVAHTVLVRESAFEQVSDDLHVAVGMHRKTVSRLNPILVDHTQGAEPHEARIVVPVEGKGEFGVEPAEVASAALLAASDGDHRVVLNNRYND